MKANRLLLCAALTISTVLAANAGTSETVIFTATVPNVLELTTSSNVAGVTLTANDYLSANAITTEATSAHQLAVRSNRAWIVSAKSNTASFSFTPAISGDTRSKPASD